MRPTKLTPEVQESIVRAIEAGGTLEAACAYSGISYQTFRNWMIEGETARKGTRLFEFFEAVTRANANILIKMSNVIAKAASEDKDWRAALEFLKRRDRAHWGDAVALTGAEGGAVQVEIGLKKVDYRNSVAETEE